MDVNNLKLDEDILRFLTIRILLLEKDNLLSNDKKSDAEMVRVLKNNIEEKVKWKLNQ